ncbi:MAG: XRE family transcriptional regulator [Cyclobacteriaceae bacterium]
MNTVSPMKKFAENLNYLRINRGISQGELAERISVSEKTIMRYESGNFNPKMNIVVSLADALNVRVDDFFNDNLSQESMMDGFKIKGVTECFSDLNYREGFKIPETLSHSIKEQTVDRLLKIKELYDLLNVNVKFNNPLEKQKPVKSKEDAQKAAIKVRKKWNIGNSPILSVVTTLENQGINVIELEAPEEFEGLSAYVNDIPIIVLNKAIKEKTRRRFTALHELGHLILTIHDDLDVNAIERICDAFAATMLIPKELLILELGEKRSRLSQNELKSLKEKYGISVKAILVGAAYSKIIDWEEYHERKNDLVGLGEYEGKEQATKFHQLVYRGIVEGQISQGKAKYFTGMSSRIFNSTIKEAYG